MLELRERPLHGAQQLVARTEKGHHLDVVGDDDRVPAHVGVGLPGSRVGGSGLGGVGVSHRGASLRGRTDPLRTESGSQPGGQVSGRPPITCTWAWKTLCWAASPVLATRR